MRRAIAALALALAATGALVPMAAHAASFPCAKATTADETAVCDHPDLNDQDVEMATLYTTLLPLLPMGGAGATRDDQKAWLARRRACGGDVACLSAAYADRIAALKAAFARIAAGGPY